MSKNNSPQTKGLFFKSVNLLNFEFKTNPEFNQKDSKLDPPQLSANYGYEKEEDEKTNHLICQMEFVLESKEKEDPFNIYALYQWVYEYSDSPDVDIDTFASDIAPAHVVSYFRELVSSITNRSIYPVFNLPLININKLLKHSSSEKKTK